MTEQRPMIGLDEVTRHYGRKPRVVQAVDGVTLEIFSGQTLGIVGAKAAAASPRLPG